MIPMLTKQTTQFGNPSGTCQVALSRLGQAESGWKWCFRIRRAAELIENTSQETATTRSPKMARLEAALFVAERALSLRKLMQVATLADVKEAASLIEQLNANYDADGSAFRIERVAVGYKMFTLPRLSKWLDRIHDRQSYMKLSAPAMETLSIIAYRQPCTRADVESIRGVQASEMIKQLMEKSLVRIVGEDDSLGRPYLYGTTKLFLETFGLTNLNQLPMADQLSKQPDPEQDAELTEGEEPDQLAA